MWNKLLKIFKNSTSLSDLVSKIKFLVQRQADTTNQPFRNPSYRIARLRNTINMLSTLISNIECNSVFSRYCCNELNIQIQINTLLKTQPQSRNIEREESLSIRSAGLVDNIYARERNEIVASCVTIKFSISTSEQTSFKVEMHCDCL